MVDYYTSKASDLIPKQVKVRLCFRYPMFLIIATPSDEKLSTSYAKIVIRYERYKSAYGKRKREG